MWDHAEYLWRQRYADEEYKQAQKMHSPVKCSHCGKLYDLGTVEVVQRYLDCSMWHCPGCNLLVDDRKPPWGIKHYDEIPKQGLSWCHDVRSEWHDALRGGWPAVVFH
jgi:hypothetical protein